MQNSVCRQCGGCVFRELTEKQYQQNKIADFQKTIALIKESSPVYDAPIFIKDGSRRRAEMSFVYAKKILKMGFNEEKTHNLVDITGCTMLTQELNNKLPIFRSFLEEFCSIPITLKNKKKKETTYIREGSIQVLAADNGIDILLHISVEPSLEHRFTVADFVNSQTDICRLSWKVADNTPETIVEKVAPELYIAGCSVKIPQGVFLQASKAAETAMIEKMLSYMGNTTGKIADLFCGLGTFTYPLAKIKGNEIVAADSSVSSLTGLQKALNANQLHNVKVLTRNLFKYPFDAADMKGVKAIVIDPPRAGAHEQCREIASLPSENKPEKIIFVSCNPKTFVYDAELLIKAGYTFERITLIDQFVYSKHQELIALFTYNSNLNKGA
ncbi:MAG: methyltransferase [Acetobacter sp.]|nr:methyltransferase [Acetobacter sp.]